MQATTSRNLEDPTREPVNRLAGSLVHIGAIVAQLEADHDLGRLSRAVVVVLTSDIRETAECGVYRVQSACQPGTWYTATTASCDCPDSTQRGTVCKHQLVLTILSVASAIASRERAEQLSHCATIATCPACHYSADLLDGLCLDCLAREADADVDPDAPIGYELTELAYTALGVAAAV